MRGTGNKTLVWSSLLVSVVLLAAGCGGEAAPSSEGASEGAGAASEGGGAVAETVDLAGVSLTVGSKEFTEQLILGQIALQALEAAGADVTDQTGLTGTPVVREALDTGEIDLYWEYTGTGWINILGETEPVKGSEEQFDAVAEADLEANGIKWLSPPAAANNTYAFAANSQAVEEFGVESISDLAALANENPEAATLCTASEFITRDDGLPGVEELYGFELPDANVAQLDFGLVYASVADADPCNFAVVFATDGQVLANDLTVLEDDKGFFPTYNIAMTMKEETYEENAEAYDTLFGAIAELITNESMTEMNAAVDVDGESAEDVAAEFLASNGIISE
ncbi:MAG: glycine betaine ABC transporter substrate-binding protein [Actinomycetota bacterium]|nr:glycine betaine ABC transporter substrate-binding protein [Actinomycetota bacterium]